MEAFSRLIRKPYSPPILNPVYGYQAVNVLSQKDRTLTALLDEAHHLIRRSSPVFARARSSSCTGRITGARHVRQWRGEGFGVNNLSSARKRSNWICDATKVISDEMWRNIFPRSVIALPFTIGPYSFTGSDCDESDLTPRYSQTRGHVRTTSHL